MNRNISTKQPVRSVRKIGLLRLDLVGFAKDQFDRLKSKNLNVPISLFQL